MTPGAFDIGTAREIVGDARTRAIESAAREDAAAGVFKPSIPLRSGGAYWDSVVSEMEARIWHAAHRKRIARLNRLKAAE